MGDEELAAMRMMGGGELPFGMTGKESQSQMMGMMYDGMEMELAIQVAGTVTQTTASHMHAKRPNRFVLMRMDFGEMMKSNAFSEDMMTGMMGMGGGKNMMASLNGFPGVVIETNTSIQISFEE